MITLKNILNYLTICFATISFVLVLTDYLSTPLKLFIISLTILIYSIYSLLKVLLVEPLTNRQWRKKNKSIKLIKLNIAFFIVISIVIFNNL